MATKGLIIGEQIVYSRDDVFIYPSKDQVIPGSLRILKQGNHIFLSWDPKARDQAARAASQPYAMKVSIGDLRSLKRFIPTIGVSHMILISKEGFAFPPMFFHSGGVREFLGALRMFATLRRSDDEPNLFFLSEYSEDPASHDNLRTSLESLNKSYSYPSTLDGNNQAQPPALHMTPDVSKTPKKEESFSQNLFESFSKVTQFARNAGQQLDRIANGGDNKAKTIQSPKDRKSEAKPEKISETRISEGGFEIVEEVLKPAPQLVLPIVQRTDPVDEISWKSLQDERGAIVEPQKAKEMIFRGGAKEEIRGEVWRYLLGYYPWSSTREERTAIEKEKRDEYEKWKGVWNMFHKDPNCKFTKLERKAHAIEKDVLRTDRHVEFYANGDAKNPHLKSLHDILLTYVFMNYDLGYVQGMNEFLSPIFYVMRDESAAFWSFHGLMQSFENNFHRDQNGMHTQLLQLSNVLQTLDPDMHAFLDILLRCIRDRECLNMFFCFRWLLIHFKREFKFDEIMRLWEVCWTNHLTPNFHLFIACSIIISFRTEIMSETSNFDDLIKFTNDKSDKIDLNNTLIHAEQLFVHFRDDAKVDPELKKSIQSRAEWGRKPSTAPANLFLEAQSQ
ncbi:GTPase-activating protein gyp7-like [Planoprotostelium fungivorum]|uniref:GTPase-activating protein gyp7-like n=1 Tax=Planoprotostelium fungivorum TaxID=1890364 RepID=A0A2P6NV10_9EUKA|nr:GTPase-activating protein gyp7-like [Planoprotostelium fungivorum]